MLSRQQKNIIESFKERSTTYFRDNYELNKNLSRRFRYDLITNLLKTFVKPNMRILDCGAGPSVFYRAVTQAGGRYFASDLSLENLAAGIDREGKISSTVSDTLVLPFRDTTFDCVISIGSLEYVHAVEMALREMVRVTNQGGFILSTYANKHSPARWWDETFINPMSSLRKRILNGKGSSYKRFLYSKGNIQRIFSANQVEVVDTIDYNQGVLGYPLSQLKNLLSILDQLSNNNKHIRRLASEFLVVARKSY